MKFSVRAILSTLPLFASSVFASSIRGAGSENTKRRLSSAPCVNSAAYAGQDEGCPVHLPICMDDDGYEPAFGVEGEECGMCVNTIDSDRFADFGCPETAKMCHAPFGKVGTMCLEQLPACTNSEGNDEEGEVDQGCTVDKPVCISSSTGQQIGADAPGDKCVTCLKMYSSVAHYEEYQDHGCGSELPRCMLADNSDPDLLTSGTKCCEADGTCPTLSPSAAPSPAPSAAPSEPPSPAPSATPSDAPSPILATASPANKVFTVDSGGDDGPVTILSADLQNGVVADSSAIRSGLPVANSAIGVDMVRGRVYYGTASGIQSSKLDGSDIQTFNGNMATGIAIESTNNKIYWVEWFGNVMSANLDGTNVQVLYNTESLFGSSSPNGVAVDTASGKLFVITYNGDDVIKSNLDGSAASMIIQNAPGQGADIAVADGRLFMAIRPTAVYTSDLNGGNFRPIVQNGGTIHAVDVDPVGKRVYYNQNNEVHSCTYDGADIQTVVSATGVVYLSKIAVVA